MNCSGLRREVHSLALRLVAFYFCLLALPQVAHSAALVVKNQLFFFGNTIVDSYNSGDPTKSTDGRYDPAKAGDDGDIYSSNPWGSPYMPRTDVYGRLYLGPYTYITVGEYETIGTHAWQAAGNSNAIEGGFRSEINFLVPDVVLPDYSQFIGPTIPGGSVITYQTTNQTFLDQSNLGLASIWWTALG